MKLTPWKLPTRPTRLHGNGPRGNAAGCVATSHIIARQWHANMRDIFLCVPHFAYLIMIQQSCLIRKHFVYFFKTIFYLFLVSQRYLSYTI